MECIKDFKQLSNMIRFALWKDYYDFSVENSMRTELMGGNLETGLLVRRLIDVMLSLTLFD